MDNYSIAEKVLLSRLQEEIDRGLTYQIELNKLIQERDHYKKKKKKLTKQESTTEE